MSSIYIATDHTKPNMCKVGMTTRSVAIRMTETENPDYELHKSFEVNADVRKIEVEVHNHLSLLYKRINHLASGRKSEWFICSVQQAEHIINAVISNFQSLYMERSLTKLCDDATPIRSFKRKEQRRMAAKKEQQTRNLNEHFGFNKKVDKSF